MGPRVVLLFGLFACARANEPTPVGAAADVQTIPALRAALAQKPDGEGKSRALAHAASRIEASFRVSKKDEDAEAAVALYEEASRASGACDAAVRHALVHAERVRDPAIAFVDLYKQALVRQECAPVVEPLLARLGAYSPPPSVLRAISLRARPPEYAPSPPKHAVIRKVDPMGGAQATRLVITLSEPRPFRLEVAPRGNGAVLVLDDTRAEALHEPRREAGALERWSMKQEGPALSIPLEFAEGATARAFALSEPFRVVVDVLRDRPRKARPGRLVSRVALDPGHGGKETGAIGPTGLREKDVVLEIAKRSAVLLSKAGISTLLTRSDDTQVSLEERTARANAFDADLFVSIHCNASEGHTRRGIETYVLDTSKDDIANRIAARENGTHPGTSSDVLSMVLNMRLSDQRARSRKFAELLQRAAVAASELAFGDATDGGVHPAGFYVLVGARMPAVLFEASYISNPVEEERLSTARSRDRFADALANAIRAYGEGR